MTSPSGTPVVLYACTTNLGDPDGILLELRQHANMHGWDIVAEYADATGAAPEADRPGFLKVKALIDGGRAAGIVTRYPAMAAYFAYEQAALTDWLTERGAWAHYTWSPPRHRHPRADDAGLPAMNTAAVER